MAAQGLERVSQLAILGDEKTVEAGLVSLESSGATDLNPILVSGAADPDCAERTRAFLAERATQQRCSGD